MRSRARLLSHPIHQILIVFPLGLLTTSIVFDLIALATRDTQWSHVATYMIGAGVLGGIAAALAGFIDYLAIPVNTRAHSVAAAHGVASVTVLLLFAIGGWLRLDSPDAVPLAALAFSLTGAIGAAVAGWLGGELVTRMGMGVDDDAGLNAVSSFAADDSRPASTVYAKPERKPVPGQSEGI